MISMGRKPKPLSSTDRLLSEIPGMKTKGPASVGALPDRGSISHRVMEMNNSDITTGPAAAPVPMICDVQLRGLTRRSLLKQSPAVLMAASIPTTAVVTALPAEAASSENPALLAAYERFLTARTEVAAAEDALEWLIDEWRHLWPVAPEGILRAANADRNSWRGEAERDIAGRYIFRDTAALTKRMTRKMREETPRTCFAVLSPEEARETISRWDDHEPKGRTEQAVSRRRAEKEKVLAEYRHKLRLSEEYHTETARLRERSGVKQVKARIKAAEKELEYAASAVSWEPAHTIDGLRLKADALQGQDDGLAIYLQSKGGALGGMARFIDAVLAVIGRASA